MHKNSTITLCKQLFPFAKDGTYGTAGMVPRVFRDYQGYQETQEQQGCQEHQEYQVREHDAFWLLLFVTNENQNLFLASKKKIESCTSTVLLWFA